MKIISATTLGLAGIVTAGLVAFSIPAMADDDRADDPAMRKDDTPAVMVAVDDDRDGDDTGDRGQQRDQTATRDRDTAGTRNAATSATRDAATRDEATRDQATRDQATRDTGTRGDVTQDDLSRDVGTEASRDD